MVMQIYNSATRLFTEQDGTEHYFFNGEAEFPEEDMTLIKFKQGELSLQDAYVVLLRSARAYTERELSRVKQDLTCKELNELQEKVNTKGLGERKLAVNKR